MAVKTRSELEDAADEIRDETTEGANTATRVGGFCRDLVDSVATAAEGAAPSGSAGGDLTGSYPNPSIANGAIDLAHLSAEVTNAIPPTNAEYLVGAVSSGLSAERLVTDTTTIVWDLATGGVVRANVPDGSLTRAKLAHASDLSVVGRAAAGTGALQDIPAPTNDRIFARVSNVLGFFQVTGPMIQVGEIGTDHYVQDSVTNAVLANMAEARIKLRAAGTGPGDPIDGTPAQATAILDLFTISLKGLTPASGGGTTNFLRADGWATLPVFAGSTPGLVPTSAGGTVSFLRADGSFAVPTAQGTAGGALTGTYPNPGIANDAVGNAQLANMAQGTLKGRASGAGPGDPTDLTPVQAADVVLPTMEFDFNVPGLSSGNSVEVTLDVTGLGLQPGDNVFVSPRPETSSWPVNAFVGAPRCQVADALIVPIAAIGGAVSSATCAMVVTRRPR